MTLQFHPIALGCMLVVAVGTLIYTYVTTTRQQEQQYGYGNRRRTSPPPSYNFPNPEDSNTRNSSRTSVSGCGEQSTMRRAKKNDDEDSNTRNSSRTSVSGCGEQSTRRRAKKNDDCIICLGTMKTAMKTLTCNHVFHAHCITTWLISNPTCPICRNKVAL